MRTLRGGVPPVEAIIVITLYVCGKFGIENIDPGSYHQNVDWAEDGV